MISMALVKGRDNDFFDNFRILRIKSDSNGFFRWRVKISHNAGNEIYMKKISQRTFLVLIKNFNSKIFL